MEETFGRYRLLERLGEGAMAEVWKAKSFGVEGFEKILALKRLLPALAQSRRFCERFIDEAKLALRLSHANVVQVFDLGTVLEGEKETYFIAMEYVAGLDLATLIARSRDQAVELPIGMCVYVAAEVAKGLEHAHRRRDEQLRPLGIVHRDVRPQNVLLSWEGEVKLSDFGIAKARDVLDEETDVSRARSGPYAYMSPEQARGQKVDARADMFSLGVLLYEMLTSVNPLRAPTAAETIARARSAEFPPVEMLRPGVPEGIAALLDKALSAAPEQRFVDAARMYESLVTCLYSWGDRFGGSELSTFVRRFRVPSAPPPSLDVDEVSGEIPVYDVDDTPVELPAVARPSSIRALDPSAVATRASELGERRDVTAWVFLFGRAEDDGAARRDRVREIVTRYGGQILEDEPTRLGALFGLIEADGHDTETAVRCALLALRRASNAAPQSSSPQPELKPSVGIHAGRILVDRSGQLTHDERLRGLLAGAADMARLRERGCGISGSAARQVQNLFRFELAAPSSSAPRDGGLLVKEPRPPSEALGRFVGRMVELHRLGEILWLAASRRAQVVTLRGPPGIGKSRLLYEADRRLRKDEYRAAFYLASCPPHGAALVFSGLTAMLQVLCGIREGDPEERIDEVEPRLRALGLHDEEVAAVLHQLGASDREGWTAAALRAGFARMVTSLCSDELHVFVWDSAQALDRASFEALEHALARGTESRAVFILATRDDAPPHPLERHPHHHALLLGELDEEDARELIARRAGVDEPTPELIDFCRERSRGHPLFIEELIKELCDSGAMVVKNRAVVELTAGGDTAVPRPLRALVAARAARLPPDERRALQAAAILGKPIELDTLSLMLGEPVAKLERLTSSLAEKGLLVRTPPGGVAFASPLLAEVVADALPVEAQRQLHAAAALALEARHGDRVFEESDRLAAHLVAAGDRDGAAAYFALSAEHKLLALHYDTAAADALRALELCDADRHDAVELATWLKNLAAAVYRVRTAHELPALIGPVLAHIDRTGDVATRLFARVELASALVSTHEFDAADQCLQAAKALAEGKPPALLRTALLTEAELARRRGDYLAALRRFEELSTLGTDDPVEAHRVDMGLALCYAASGAPEQARETLARAEALLLGDDAALACETAKLRQVIALMSRDFAEAIRAGEAAVQLAREAGLGYETAINLHLLAEGLFRSGELPRAYAAFAQSAALCDEMAEERLLAHNRSFLAYLDSSSDFDGALQTLEESIAYAHAHRYVRDEVNARYLLATLQKEQGRGDSRAEFERCLRLARSVGFRLVVEDCDAALRAGEAHSA